MTTKQHLALHDKQIAAIRNLVAGRHEVSARHAGIAAPHGIELGQPDRRAWAQWEREALITAAMTSTQLYLAIGVPILFNFGVVLAFFLLLNRNMNARFDAINQRFDDMRDLWRAELRRVEEVIDARLKHLEEK